MTMIRYKERKAAVEYCIEHGRDYKVTAAPFRCTYQQIYSWMRAYHAGGLERLSGTRKAQKYLSSEVVEENRRLREKESSLELEFAVCRQL